MYGVVNGCYRCDDNRVQELNSRISERNIPFTRMQSHPQYGIQSISTKYTKMGVADQKNISTIPINNTINISNIEIDSNLRMQGYSSSMESMYVPSSTSDLYNDTVRENKQISQPFPRLFEEPEFNSFNPNTENLGRQIFQNATRTQMNNLE